MRRLIMQLLYTIRPLHWLKNILVFAPVFFAGEITSVERMIPAFYAFIVFCCCASILYIINDLVDRQQDALHPHKRARPIASGLISGQALLPLVALLAVSGLVMLYFFIPRITIVAGMYFVLGLAYSLFLKNIAVVELFVLVLLYLMRIFAGGVASSIVPSPWLILCTVFLALFLISAKRRAELVHPHYRSVLVAYPPLLLDWFLVISTALTIASYSIYTIIGAQWTAAPYSIFFVVVGIFRYLFNVITSPRAEYPERLIFTDSILTASIIGWLLFMYATIYIL